MQLIEVGPGDQDLINRIVTLDLMAFPDRTARWSVEEIATMAHNPQDCVVADANGHAFAIGRTVLDEAEILTIGTDPSMRRQGLASRLLAHLESWARGRGAAAMFLEVASTNHAACALYLSRGYREVGKRSGYYRIGADRVDALVLRLALTDAQNH